MPPLRAPEFWQHDGLAAHLLAPVGWGHGVVGAARRALTRPWRAAVPVLCIGNLVAGGAGKTPVTLSLARRAAARGLVPHCLTRGYGGRLAGPVAVERARHAAQDVGDEALLLAAAAPSWVAHNRIAGAKAAIAAGAQLLLLDDGFQNPALAKDLSLLVVDGAFGFGNGRVLPAGPLREPVAAALGRADAVVVLGADEADVLAQLGTAPVLRGRLQPVGAPDLAGEAVVAFAGIGRPAKFFRTLEELGAQLVARHSFPDHHPYREEELAVLLTAAERANARLVTTEKDRVRLPPLWRRRVSVVKVEMAWQDAAAVEALLDRLMARERPGG